MKVALILPLMLAASSTLAQPAGQRSVADVRSEAARAEAEAARLSKAADEARGEAARRAAGRLAAAADISSAEARISEADAILIAREAQVRDSSARLSAKQAPAAALVAGVINLGRRPPILSLAADRDLAQMVRMRALLDAALPRIRAQSAALSAEVEANRRLVQQAATARRALAAARAELGRRQQRFAELERQSISRAAGFDAGASGADDRMLAANAGAASLGSQQQRAQAASKLARELASLPPATARPFGPDSRAVPAPVAVVLPLGGPVVEGLGQISPSGIRSRGTTFAARLGTPVMVPADGVLVFAGPFRRHDGIAVIAHRDGWMSLLVGVRTTMPRGTRLVGGTVLGKALGPVTIELSTNGRPASAILMARRS
ncbi:MAG: hypothetical protein ABIN83_08325 [Sphingomicrobium sp.]